MATTTTAFEAEIVTGFSLFDRGMMAGAAYRLRRAYQAGMVDPAAHTLAKGPQDYVDALTRNAKMVSFDAITAA